MTENGIISTFSSFAHPIYSLVHVLEKLPVNIVSAYEITHNDKFEAIYGISEKRRILRINFSLSSLNEVIPFAQDLSCASNFDKFTNFTTRLIMEEPVNFR